MLFSNFVRSYKKGLRLTKISKTLSDRTASNVLENIRNGVEDNSQEVALKQLFDLCQSEEGLRILLKMHNCDFNKFALLYTKLKLNGATQWVKGHWVAASALVYGGSLEYLLRNVESKNFENIVFRLMRWFENKETGRIEEL